MIDVESGENGSRRNGNVILLRLLAMKNLCDIAAEKIFLDVEKEEIVDFLPSIPPFYLLITPDILRFGKKRNVIGEVSLSLSLSPGYRRRGEGKSGIKRKRARLSHGRGNLRFSRRRRDIRFR